MTKQAALLALALLSACSGAPTGDPLTDRPAQANVVAAPTDSDGLTPAEPHPTAIVIDERFAAQDQAAIVQAVADWCALEPTLCIATTVGPVVQGQRDSFWRDSATPGCPYYGLENRETAQMSIPDSCTAGADLAREHHLTTGEIAAHELGHYFGALHTPEENTLMNGAGARHMARCTTAADLAEVCAHHECSAPRFDLVCTDEQAAASNPYTPYN